MREFVLCQNDIPFDIYEEVPYEWYDDIPQHGILCKTEAGNVILVRNKNQKNQKKVETFGNEYYYIEFITPLTDEEIKMYLRGSDAG